MICMLSCYLQGVNFYTQVKTVTQMWRESDVAHSKAAVSMPVMQWMSLDGEDYNRVHMSVHFSGNMLFRHPIKSKYQSQSHVSSLYTYRLYVSIHTDCFVSVHKDCLVWTATSFFRLKLLWVNVASPCLVMYVIFNTCFLTFWMNIQYTYLLPSAVVLHCSHFSTCNWSWMTGVTLFLLTCHEQEEIPQNLKFWVMERSKVGSFCKPLWHGKG